MPQLIVPAVPRLPTSREAYDRLSQEFTNNVLRLYFQQLNGVVNSVVSTHGGQYIDCPNGLFFSTTSQSFAAQDTAYPITYNNTYLNNAVSLASGSTSRIQVEHNGIYNFQYTGQVSSGSASAKTIYLWIRRDGTDIGYSTRAVTATTNNQYTPLTWSFSIDLQAGSYIELMASVTNTAIQLAAAPAAAPHPGIPSSVMTVNYMSSLPPELPTPP